MGRVDEAMKESTHRELFIKRSRFPVSAEVLYNWHATPGALQRLTPPWERVEVIDEGGVMEGSLTTFSMGIGPLTIRWTAKHSGVTPGRQFVDEQVHGPFSSWRHRHIFTADGDGCFLEDRIEYRFPLHPIVKPFIGRFIRRKIERMFEYRHRTTREDVVLRQRRRPLAIAVTGAKGLIGRNLVPFLETQGHRVVQLVRRKEVAADLACWDPENGCIYYDFSGCDAVIHLAGEPISEGAWTKDKMKSIMDSRTVGTRLVAEALAAMEKPPAVFISASAIGYYGNRGDAVLSEESEAGSDFISEVCRAWEAAARPAAERGIRVVFIRIGVVLHPGGGALARYLPAVRTGFGGVMGTGRQFISWISMDDLIGAVEHILFTGEVRGPVNLAAPEPVTNKDFVRTLARVLGRPSLVSIPAFCIRAIFGRMGREVLLSGARVSSHLITASGYRFRHENLEDALHFLLGI